MKRQILLLALLLSVTVNAFAEEAEIGGLWYELVLKAKEAKVIQNKYGIKYTGDIVIPETVEYEGVSYSVTGIGRSAFYNCNNLKSITIPNCIKSIGNAAFYECSGLTSVYITDIDAWCKITFSDCDSNPLYYAHHLFLNEKEITDLVIPNSVKSIGDYAFYYCIGLKSVIIQGGVTSIGNYAFSWCGGMTSVIIQNGVASIGHDAFYACSGLTSISIPNSIVTIGRYAFSGCINLISANIPGNVTSIENNTFYECRSLTTVTIQDGVKSIGLDAFHGCAKLTSVTVPNSVTWIGSSAFQGCSAITAITIGSGVETIYTKAFADCLELTDVYCYAENVPIMKQYYYPHSLCTDAFEGSYIEYATLHVPAASIDAYKSTAPWSSFKSIVARCATPTIAFVDGELTFSCETEDVEYVSEITSKEVKKYYDSKVKISGTYTVSVYAMKTGWENSDVATLEFTVGTDGTGVLGDVNGDGIVDVSDYIGVANIILTGTVDGKKE